MVVRGEQDGYYFSDAQGSVTFVAGTEPQVTRTEYDPWGVILSGARDGSTISYTGQWRDDQTGLMPLGNGERYYDPLLGRFIQEDSFAGMYTLPQSLNRYAYVHNNPTRFTDPSGHVGLLATTGIGAAVGAVFGFLVDFGYQTVDVYFTGQRDTYDLSQLGMAALQGGAIGAAIGSGAIVAEALGVGAAYGVGVTIGGVGTGLYSAYLNYQDQRYGYMAVDLAATFLPFGFKSVRAGTAWMFNEFTGSGYSGFSPAKGRLSITLCK